MQILTHIYNRKRNIFCRAKLEGIALFFFKGDAMYDFNFCMKQECKVCSKKIECEKSDRINGIKKVKNTKHKKHKKNANIKDGVTYEL